MDKDTAETWIMPDVDCTLLHSAANTIEDMLNCWWSTPRSRRRARKLVQQLRNRVSYRRG
jgi:hypothetical protein